MVRELTAAERMRIGAALGRPALRPAEALCAELNQHGRARAESWRAFLRALHEGAGEAVMSSPLGLAVQLAIVGRIQGAMH